MKTRIIFLVFLIMFFLVGCGVKEHSVIFGEKVVIEEVMSLESSVVSELELMESPMEKKLTKIYEVTFTSDFQIDAETSDYIFYVMNDGQRYEGVELRELLNSITVPKEKMDDFLLFNPLFKEKEGFVFNQDTLEFSGTLYFEWAGKFRNLSFHIENRKNSISINSSLENKVIKDIEEYMVDGFIPDYVNDDAIIEIIDYYQVDDFTLKINGNDHYGEVFHSPFKKGVIIMEVIIKPFADEMNVPAFQIKLPKTDQYGVAPLAPNAFVDGYENFLNGKSIEGETHGFLTFFFYEDLEFNKNEPFMIMVDSTSEGNFYTYSEIRMNGYKSDDE